VVNTSTASAIKRLALVTDAWHPQTNGVVNTLSRLVRYLESIGIEVFVATPDGHRTMPMPLYDEIRLTCDPWKAVRRIRAFRPDAVHVATEGPLGICTRVWMARKRMRFTTSFHTRFPEYIRARMPVPVGCTYFLERWFHGKATRTMVGTLSLIRELERRGI